MKEDLSTQKEENALYEKLANRVITMLKRRGVNAHYTSNREKALSMVMEMIPEGATVGTADSITLLQVGVISALNRRSKNEIINPHRRDGEGNLVVDTGEERDDLMRKVFSSDVFIISTNAVTLDGKLVNIDGYGNRVAAMIFGPKKVIIVAGTNKIVKDVDEAIKRIKAVCAPQITIKHGTTHHRPQYLELPCAKTGLCSDCNHPWRVCHYTTIIEGEMGIKRGRMNVILVGEKLGI